MPLDPLPDVQASPPQIATTTATFVVLLAQIPPARALWHMQRFLLGRFGLHTMPGLRFHKMLGSGYEGGFGLRPSFTRHGVMAFFADDDSARAFLASDFVDGYRQRASEFFYAVLTPVTSRGSWSGFSPDLPAQGPLPRTLSAAAPVAALTRGSINLLRAPRFWSKAAPAQAAVEHAPGCRLAVGLGEAPLLRQATFSLWDSVAAMDAYARRGAHLAAIQATHQHQLFTESMFVRFLQRDVQGTWKGRRYGAAAGQNVTDAGAARG
jgi:hypothetical protein